MSSNDIKRVQMTSKEFKWNQKSSHEIKRVHNFTWNQKNSHEIKIISMRSNNFKWNQKSSNDIKRIHMKSNEFKWNHWWIHKNSNEICKNYRKMWIYRDFLRKMLLIFHKWTQSPLKIEKNVTKISWTDTKSLKDENDKHV